MRISRAESVAAESVVQHVKRSGGVAAAAWANEEANVTEEGNAEAALPKASHSFPMRLR
jgi:hypothetical protein